MDDSYSSSTSFLNNMIQSENVWGGMTPDLVLALVKEEGERQKWKDEQETIRLKWKDEQENKRQKWKDEQENKRQNVEARVRMYEVQHETERVKIVEKERTLLQAYLELSGPERFAVSLKMAEGTRGPLRFCISFMIL